MLLPEFKMELDNVGYLFIAVHSRWSLTMEDLVATNIFPAGTILGDNCTCCYWFMLISWCGSKFGSPKLAEQIMKFCR
jgi:hypothetical protein